MHRQVFLGGAAGETTWRRDIAIPALTAAGVTYADPQLPLGAWTEAREREEMQAKDEADVLLFVLTGQTRGVATVAEIAYYLAQNRQLALSIEDIEPGAVIAGKSIEKAEADDLNRGRIFLRTMARAHKVPVFDSIPGAVRYAIQLVQPQSLDTIRHILSEVHCGDFQFHVEPNQAGFLLHIEAQKFTGRKWHIAPEATRAEIVRTALKAALTWEEHETRERFTYRGKQVFGPHFEL